MRRVPTRRRVPRTDTAAVPGSCASLAQRVVRRAVAIGVTAVVCVGGGILSPAGPLQAAPAEAKRPTTTTAPPTTGAPQYEAGGAGTWCDPSVVCENTATSDHVGRLLAVDLDVRGAGSTSCVYLPYCFYHDPFTAGGTGAAWLDVVQDISRSARSVTLTVTAQVSELSIVGTPPPACAPVYGSSFVVGCAGFTLVLTASYPWVDGEVSGTSGDSRYVVLDQSMSGTTQTWSISMPLSSGRVGPVTLGLALSGAAGSEVGEVDASAHLTNINVAAVAS